MFESIYIFLNKTLGSYYTVCVGDRLLKAQLLWVTAKRFKKPEIQPLAVKSLVGMR